MTSRKCGLPWQRSPPSHLALAVRTAQLVRKLQRARALSGSAFVSRQSVFYKLFSDGNICMGCRRRYQRVPVPTVSFRKSSQKEIITGLGYDCSGSEVNFRLTRKLLAEMPSRVGLMLASDLRATVKRSTPIGQCVQHQLLCSILADWSISITCQSV